MTTNITRRGLVGSMAALASAGLPSPSLANGTTMTDRIHRPETSYRLGDAELIVLSDGQLALGSATDWFKGLPEAEVVDLLRSNSIDSSDLRLSENILLLEKGGRKVLFDTGTGGDPRLGAAAGHLHENLAAFGIDPASINDVVISHGHPDHMFGLVGQDGTALFPNATVHMPEIDLAFLRDEASLSNPKIAPFIAESLRQIDAVGDRLMPYADGAELAPGVQALAAPGHTPGHCVMMIEADGQTLLYGADLGHHHLVFTRHPEARFASDIDPDQMAATRAKMFDMIASDRLEFVGYHFPFPGIGRLVNRGKGYDWVPRSLYSESDLLIENLR